LDEAVAAVEETLDSSRPFVDRRLVREDPDSFLLVVLDISGGRFDDDTPIANGSRLVDKHSGEVVRLPMPAAVARAERMILVEA
jgi:hypothetical protein